MPAELIPSPDGEQPHWLRLPSWQESGDAVAEVRDSLLLSPQLRGSVALQGGQWPLRIGDFLRLMEVLESAALSLVRVSSQEEGAQVAAAALGLAVESGAQGGPGEEGADAALPLPPALSIHQGTLRSGDHWHAAGSLLVLGDVNAGAQVSAAGHVMVWGRLRGIAHAGRTGDRSALIVALHLQPLQLRIADQVARGPAEAPPLGLAEKAHLVDGEIRIDPAEPFWPLGMVTAPSPGQPETMARSGLA